MSGLAETPPAIGETIGGARRRLLLRNDEIERFELRHAPLGIFEMLDRLMGRGPAPQARQVRDLVALGLVGGGMTDREADAVMAALGPEANLVLLAAAQRLVVATFVPAAGDAAPGKPPAGSSAGRSRQPRRATTSPPASAPSAARSPA
ncbi:MAG: GTA-gp10 family protein [Gemmobacter sp.]